MKSDSSFSQFKSNYEKTTGLLNDLIVRESLDLLLQQDCDEEEMVSSIDIPDLETDDEIDVEEQTHDVYPSKWRDHRNDNKSKENGLKQESKPRSLRAIDIKVIDVKSKKCRSSNLNDPFFDGSKINNERSKLSNKFIITFDDQNIISAKLDCGNFDCEIINETSLNRILNKQDLISLIEGMVCVLRSKSFSYQYIFNDKLFGEYKFYPNIQNLDKVIELFKLLCKEDTL